MSNLTGIKWKFPVVALAIMLLISLFGSFAFAAPSEEVLQIRKAIKAKSARWTAGETTISKLKPEHRKNYLGMIEPAESGAPAQNSTLLAAELSSPVPSLDWRNYGSNSYVTPVRNQGSCGSCWAFAATAALESQVLIGLGLPNSDLNLSEQVLVSCSGAGTCSGGYPSSASNYIRDTGLPLESCFYYTATNGSCSNSCANWQQNSYGITGWTSVSPTLDAIRNALYTYGPLMVTMRVYSDFFSYRTGIYSYVSGTYQGGHAILLVGYDDPNQCFIAKNSWGTGWGESGFFRIAYSELASVVGFGASTIAYGGYEPLPRPCSYSVSPVSKSMKAGGGSASSTVSAGGGCSWAASSNVSWITITAGMSGSGSGTVSYAVTANPNKTSRTGSLSVAGQTVVVTQAGARTR